MARLADREATLGSILPFCRRFTISCSKVSTTSLSCSHSIVTYNPWKIDQPYCITVRDQCQERTALYVAMLHKQDLRVKDVEQDLRVKDVEQE